MKILITQLTKPRGGRVGVGGDDKNKYGYKTNLDDKDKIGGNKVNCGKVRDNKFVEEKNHQKIFKSKKMSKSKKTIKSLDFFTLGAKLAFTK